MSQEDFDVLRTAWEAFSAHRREDFLNLTHPDVEMVPFGHWVARGRTSGVDLHMPATWVVDIRDGKIARWQTFTDRDEALAAARG